MKTRIPQQIICLVLALTAWSCSNTPAPSAAKHSDVSSDSEGSGAESSTSTDSSSTASKAPAKKIDPATLLVYNITAGRTSLGAIDGNAVEFNVLGGNDYVKYEICPLQITDQTCTPSASTTCSPAGGECNVDYTSFNRLLLPPIYGRISLRLQGCVSPERSINGTTCGAFSDPKVIDFQQIDSNIAKLLIRKEQLIDQITAYEDKKFEVFYDFKRDAEVCLERARTAEDGLRAKLTIINSIIRVPARTFKEAIAAVEAGDQAATDGAITGAVGDVFKDLGATIGVVCNSAGGVKMVCDGVAGMKEMANMMNPLIALAMLSNNIHDVMHPEAAVTQDCSKVEDDMSTRLVAIRKQVLLLQSDLKGVFAQLKAAGVYK